MRSINTSDDSDNIVEFQFASSIAYTPRVSRFHSDLRKLEDGTTGVQEEKTPLSLSSHHHHHQQSSSTLRLKYPDVMTLMQMTEDDGGHDHLQHQPASCRRSASQVASSEYDDLNPYDTSAAKIKKHKSHSSSASASHLQQPHSPSSTSTHLHSLLELLSDTSKIKAHSPKAAATKSISSTSSAYCQSQQQPKKISSSASSKALLNREEVNKNKSTSSSIILPAGAITSGDAIPAVSTPSKSSIIITPTTAAPTSTVPLQPKPASVLKANSFSKTITTHAPSPQPPPEPSMKELLPECAAFLTAPFATLLHHPDTQSSFSAASWITASHCQSLLACLSSHNLSPHATFHLLQSLQRCQYSFWQHHDSMGMLEVEQQVTALRQGMKVAWSMRRMLSLLLDSPLASHHLPPITMSTINHLFESIVNKLNRFSLQQPWRMRYEVDVEVKVVEVMERLLKENKEVEIEKLVDMVVEEMEGRKLNIAAVLSPTLAEIATTTQIHPSLSITTSPSPASTASPSSEVKPKPSPLILSTSPSAATLPNSSTPLSPSHIVLNAMNTHVHKSSPRAAAHAKSSKSSLHIQLQSTSNSSLGVIQPLSSPRTHSTLLAKPRPQPHAAPTEPLKSIRANLHPQRK